MANNTTDSKNPKEDLYVDIIGLGFLGVIIGAVIGAAIGANVGAIVGVIVGAIVGVIVGRYVGRYVGKILWKKERERQEQEARERQAIGKLHERQRQEIGKLGERRRQEQEERERERLRQEIDELNERQRQEIDKLNERQRQEIGKLNERQRQEIGKLHDRQYQKLDERQERELKELNEREEREARERAFLNIFYKDFGMWLYQAGMDMECGQCMSRSFYIIQYVSHGLSFQGQCTSCRAKKWFKVTRDRTPFPFEEYERIFLAEGFYITAPPLHEQAWKEETPALERRISTAVKREVWRRDNGKCVECDSKERLEYDHIIPFSKGGSNTSRNIQLLCEACNRKKHAHI